MSKNILLIFLSDVKTALDKIFIFASKTVRENHITSGGKKFIGSDGKPKTHLEYFTARIGNIAAENDDVILHVDLTGGMRHINMMMLDVIRLLEYSGIKIGKIIYSNFASRRVEEISSIYDLFQLIAGVEEFVRFGSVKALKDYYRDKNLSPALENLILAMENFADEIKLCHYGQLKNSIIRLHDAVHDFAAADDVQDILMARLIGRIRRDYQSLIELRDLDDLRVIRWCVDNSYMQQALTLYTERVPEYLGSKNFLTVSAEEKAKIRKQLVEMRIDKLNFYFYLLNNYLETADEFNKISRALLQEIDKLHRPYLKLVKEDTFTAIRKGSFDYDSWRQQVGELLDETCAKFQLERGDILCEDEELLRAKLELLAALRDNPAPLLSPDSLAPFKKFFAYKDGKFKAELEKIPAAADRFKKFLELLKQRDDTAKKYLPNLKPKKYPQTLRLYEMIQGGIFAVTIPEKIFLSIMDKYFRLKIERNHSNHAHTESGEFSTAEALKMNSKIFVNHTNHASAQWSAEQTATAETFGKIVDVPFPPVPPDFDETAVAELVAKNLREILKLNPAAVLCQGEFNYTFAMVAALKSKNIPALAATTERVTSEISLPDGSTAKSSVFKFVRFRRY